MVSVLVGLRMVNFSAVAVLSFSFDLITCVCDCRDSSSVGVGPVFVVAVAMSSGSLTLELSATRSEWVVHRSPASCIYQGQDLGSDLFIYILMIRREL